jgi:hypothetical protein
MRNITPTSLDIMPSGSTKMALGLGLLEITPLFIQNSILVAKVMPLSSSLVMISLWRALMVAQPTLVAITRKFTSLHSKILNAVKTS